MDDIGKIKRYYAVVNGLGGIEYVQEFIRKQDIKLHHPDQLGETHPNWHFAIRQTQRDAIDAAKEQAKASGK